MLNESQLKFMCYCQFSMILGVLGDFRRVVLCKSGKEYLNEKKTCKLYNFPVHNFETFGILHTLPSLNYQRSNTCIHVKSICYSQIWQNFGDDEYLCKSGKEYLNALLCKFVVYSLQHSETFDVSHVFLPLTIAELSTLKQVRFILAHPV